MSRTSLLTNRNTVPTTSFHRNTHGTNIQIEENGFKASRHTSFDNGITFTSKPIQMDERIYMKIVDVDHTGQWLGSLAIGFTQFNPNFLQPEDLCKSALPNLCSKTGTSYLKRIFETLTRDIVITFYYNQDGAFYILNGIEHELHKNISRNQPLWGVIDIYGNVKAIVFTTAPQVVDASRDFFQKYDQTPDKLPIKYFKNLRTDQLQQIGFLDGHGPEIELFCHNQVAFRRNVRRLSRPYLFFDFPMSPGDEFYIRILSMDPNYLTAGALGFTNAERINFVEKFNQLPNNDLMALYDRKEFWIFNESAFPDDLGELDEYRITFEKNGEFHMCRNNDPKTVRTVVYGDASQKFYPFFFLNGRINALSLMGVVSPNQIAKPIVAQSPTSTQNNDDNLCKICYDEPADLVLIPCGHIFFCSDCKTLYEQKSGKKCPVCRENYINALKIAN